jgi:3-oxoacyl-[acyl-carrier-protein] synthase II
MRRVVVTGIGALSPLGKSAFESWEAAKAGQCGIGPITRFDASGLPWNTGGEIRGFRAESFLAQKDLRRVDPFVQYAAAASMMAVEDAGLKGQMDSAAVVFGSSRGGINMIENACSERVSAFLMPGSTVSMGASYVAGILGVRGHILGISNACSSGSNAIGEAFRLIRHGMTGIAIAGGADAPVCGLGVRGYGAMGALSKQGVSRPFDRLRDGFVLSEGAAAVVLEELTGAIGRGAKIYGEVLGYGNTSDSFHMTTPLREGQARAMEAAIEEAALSNDQVDYISTHATSTPVGDKTEAEAIRLVFGSRRILMSAVKSMTGHMLGASGAMEAVFALMSISEGIVPPTVNVNEPEHDFAISDKAEEGEINVALSNSFGFGGVNSVLVFSKQ